MEIIKHVFKALESECASLKFEQHNNHAFLQHRESTVRVILFRRVRYESEWSTVWPIVGVHHRRVAEIVNLTNDGKSLMTLEPTFQIWLGRIMSGTNRSNAKRYSCYPSGEWEFRSLAEVEPKVSKMCAAVKRFSWPLFERAESLEYLASYDPHLKNENPPDFIKYQIIAANLLGSLDLAEKLINYYQTTKYYDNTWLHRLNMYFGNQ